MSKSDVLTREEMARYTFGEGTYRMIREFAQARGLHPRGMRILDWGSGRGRGVAWLREREFDAYGVDVDPVPVRNAERYFEERGLDHRAALRLLDGEGGAPFPSGHFHFSYSDQVLEHVPDLDAVARELGRVMAGGGQGLHIFPAHRRLVEPHLFMPLVHWLPKNIVGKALVGLWVFLGVEPRWPELEGKSHLRKTDAYFDYLSRKTHYRSPGLIRDGFSSAGFKVVFRSVRHGRRLESGIFRIPLARRAAQWAIRTFFTVEMIIEKA
jgi:SAM-dependent methyltransferase